MSYLEVSVPTVPQIFILNLVHNVAYMWNTHGPKMPRLRQSHLHNPDVHGR
jgi:hypothetical protein